MVIFEALFGCPRHPMRQCPDMTIAVDWNVKHQFKPASFLNIHGIKLRLGLGDLFPLRGWVRKFCQRCYITINRHDRLLNYTLLARATFLLYDGPDLKLFILVGWGRSFLSVAWPTGVQLVFFFCSGVSRLFGAQGSPSSGSLLNL